MKQIIFLIFLLSLVFNSRAQLAGIPQKEIPADYGFKVKIGEQIPNVDFELTNGKTITPENLRGKIVMLQFTASWCGVCRKEMPHIEKEIWQKHKNNPDFVLIGVDMNEPMEKVKKFGEDVRITYPLALDPGAEIFYTFAEKGAGVTRNVIIDKNGKIVYLTRLFKEDEFNEMKQVINFLLQNS